MVATIRHHRRCKRAVSNVIVVMLSLVLIVIIVSNVVLWSYQMNQLDWEKIQERIAVTNVDRVTRSAWLTSQDEYIIQTGNILSGTYTDTWTVGGGYETFQEEEAPTFYHPSEYSLGASTRYVSGSTSDVATNNGAYLVFESYPSAFSTQTLYAHREQTTVAGEQYYQLRPAVADSSEIALQADASTTGRKLLGKFTYPLTGITSIPTSTWTLYYRAYKTGPDTQTTAHCDIDVLIRKVDGTVRTYAIADAANSPNLNRDAWSTVSATVSWVNYTVIDETDFLEVDCYAHVTRSQAGRSVYLSIDNQNLEIQDQTRITGLTLPSTHTVDVELVGSSNTLDWQTLNWTIENAFTISDVNTTLQLYDCSASQYPTSGDGYISYFSSAIPNVDETQSKTIIADATRFRSNTTEWKIRITGSRETNLPFELKIDLVELETTQQQLYQLNINCTFESDLSAYPLGYIKGIEIAIRYNVSDASEKWFLKAYNWTAKTFTDEGFNTADGSQPTLNEWNEYTVSVIDHFADYISSDGTLIMEFRDEASSTDQATVEIDFFCARIMVNGIRLDITNSSPFTTHIVAIWMINSTNHQRFNANLFMNSGEDVTYTRVDISLPLDRFVIRVATERGNLAVYP
jgi:hypothetical protein